jgi:hypothetical protein
MRTFNILIMLGLAGITAFLGIIMLISNANDFSKTAPLISSLTGFSVISVAYLTLTLRASENSAKLQAIIFIAYLISAASGAAAASSIGLIAYIMKSMSLSFIPSLEYVWLPVLSGGTVAITVYVFTHIYSRRKSTTLMQAEHQSA